MNSQKFVKNIGQKNINTIEDALNYIKTKMLTQLKSLGYSNYTVSLKSNNTKIGTCGLCNRHGVKGIDIGFAFYLSMKKWDMPMKLLLN